MMGDFGHKPFLALFALSMIAVLVTGAVGVAIYLNETHERACQIHEHQR